MCPSWACTKIGTPLELSDATGNTGRSVVVAVVVTVIAVTVVTAIIVTVVIAIIITVVVTVVVAIIISVVVAIIVTVVVMVVITIIIVIVIIIIAIITDKVTVTCVDINGLTLDNRTDKAFCLLFDDLSGGAVIDDFQFRAVPHGLEFGLRRAIVDLDGLEPLCAQGFNDTVRKALCICRHCCQHAQGRAQQKGVLHFIFLS